MESELVLIAAKLEERARFERAGAWLYEALLDKEPDPAFPEPTREQLREFRDQELAHLELALDILTELGKEPDRLAEPIDIGSAAVAGLLTRVKDEGTSLTQGLEGLLIAELADREGWETLIQLCEDGGMEIAAQRFRVALLEEKRHLASVRGWLKARIFTHSAQSGHQAA